MAADRLHLYLTHIGRNVCTGRACHVGISRYPPYKIERKILATHETIGPNPTQLKLVVLLTTVFTFIAGVYAAQGRTDLFLAMLVVLAVGWLLVVAWGLGEKREREGIR